MHALISKPSIENSARYENVYIISKSLSSWKVIYYNIIQDWFADTGTIIDRPSVSEVTFGYGINSFQTINKHNIVRPISWNLRYIPTDLEYLIQASGCRPCQEQYSLRRHCLIGVGISIINLRRSSDRLRFIIGIPVTGASFCWIDAQIHAYWC